MFFAGIEFSRGQVGSVVGLAEAHDGRGVALVFQPKDALKLLRKFFPFVRERISGHDIGGTKRTFLHFGPVTDVAGSWPALALDIAAAALPALVAAAFATAPAP